MCQNDLEIKVFKVFCGYSREMFLRQPGNIWCRYVHTCGYVGMCSHVLRAQLSLMRHVPGQLRGNQPWQPEGGTALGGNRLGRAFHLCLRLRLGYQLEIGHSQGVGRGRGIGPGQVILMVHGFLGKCGNEAQPGGVKNR